MNYNKIITALIAFFMSVPETEAITFKDKAGSLVIDNLTSWRITKASEKELIFTGGGAPLFANFLKQNMEIYANSIEGSASGENMQSIALARAALNGSVKMKLLQDQARTVLSAEKADYNAILHTLNLTGPVNLESFNTKTSQKFQLSGSKADFVLFPPSHMMGNKIKTGNLYGKVNFALSRQDTPTSFTQLIHGKCDKMEVGSDAKVLTLHGNVYIDNKTALMPSEISADKAIIRFNDKNEILDIDLSGKPGKTTFHPKVK